MLARLAAVPVLIVLLSAVVAAQPGDSPGFSPGDKVLFKFGTKSEPAVVVTVRPTGVVEIRLDSRPQSTRHVPARLLQAAGPNNAPAPAAAPAAPAAGEEPQRTWTDISGRHKIEAKMTSQDDSTVTLLRSDGRSVRLPIARLSVADQKYVAERMGGGDNPFEPTDDGPAAPAAGGQPLAAEIQWGATWYKGKVLKKRGKQYYVSYDGWSENHNEWVTAERLRAIGGGRLRLDQVAENAATTDSDGAVAKAADYSQVKEIPAAQTVGAWRLALDTAAHSAAGMSDRAAIDMPKMEFFENATSLVLARAQGKALVTLKNAPPGKSASVRLVLCDLRSGQVDGVFQAPTDAMVVDVRGDGNELLAVKAGTGFGKSERVDLWQPGPGGFQNLVSFIPYETDGWSTKDVSWARYVDQQHVLTCSRGGKLVLWEVPAAKAVWSMDIRRGCTPALSANRKYLALATDQGVGVYNPLTAEQLGQLPADGIYSGALEFRADGRYLAAASGKRVVVWDLTTGESYRDMIFTTPLSGHPVDWVAGDYLVVDNQYLIDIERRIVLWHYKGQSANSDMLETVGELSWYVVPGKESALRAVRLPHDRALQTAEKLNADDLLLLKPGAEVSLQIRTQGNQQQITQALTNQLQANGVRVSPNSPIQVIATTRPGEQREVSYRQFGAGSGNTQSRTIIEHISRLEVAYQGKVAWEAQVVSGPSHFLHLKEGQTLDDALREAQKPDLKFFERVKIPQQIVTPTGTIAYGASQITAGSIEHVDGGL